MIRGANYGVLSSKSTRERLEKKGGRLSASTICLISAVAVRRNWIRKMRYLSFGFFAVSGQSDRGLCSRTDYRLEQVLDDKQDTVCVLHGCSFLNFEFYIISLPFLYI